MPSARLHALFTALYLVCFEAPIFLLSSLDALSSTRISTRRRGVDRSVRVHRRVNTINSQGISNTVTESRALSSTIVENRETIVAAATATATANKQETSSPANANFRKRKHDEMAPVKKKARTTKSPPSEETAVVRQKQESTVLSDRRTSWLVKGDDQMVELKARGETFVVPRSVLCRNSEYFDSAFNGQFLEAKNGVIDFNDDVDPRYLALYIGVAHSFSTIIPPTTPRPSKTPEATAPEIPLVELIQVYKLCDRFISFKMGHFMASMIDHAIGEGHRALRRTEGDEGLQKVLTRDFADGYEALDLKLATHEEIRERMEYYFTEGVSYRAWSQVMMDLVDRSKFVAAVCKRFAIRLDELEGNKKLKRKELGGPGRSD